MKYIESLREGIRNCIERYNAIVLGEDIAEPYGGAFKATRDLSVLYPKHIYPTPMSEQGFSAMGIGCALAEQAAIVEITFCDFTTLLADQLINHAAKIHDLYGIRLPVVFRSPSGGYGGYGATHSQCLERLFIGIPGLQVLSPSVLHQPGNMLTEAIASGIPTLFIENKLDYSRNLINMEAEDFVFSFKKYGSISEVTIRGEKPDATIITYGGMIPICMEILSDLFLRDEIALQLLVLSSLGGSPEAVCKAVKSRRALFVEEGWTLYGIGSEYVAALAENGIYAEKTGALPHQIFSGKQLESSVLPNERTIVDKLKKVLRQ